MRTINEICNSLTKCADQAESRQEWYPIGQEIRRCVEDLRVTERSLQNNIWTLQVLTGCMEETKEPKPPECPCHGSINQDNRKEKRNEPRADRAEG